MQKMYENYKDVAEFRLVYIKEAHAADSNRPVPYAKEMGITNHKDYGQRCSVASKLLSDKNLTIPTLIDDMDDSVNKAYKGWPDRVFLVRKDGTLAVAARRGPWGFKPGVRAAKKWLGTYKDTGIEPANAEPETKDASDSHASRGDMPHGRVIAHGTTAPMLGNWKMSTEFQGGHIPAMMALTMKDGKLTGTWSSQGMDMPMKEIEVNGKTLKFKRQMGDDGPALVFEGTLNGSKIEGTYTGQFGQLKTTGTRTD